MKVAVFSTKPYDQASLAPAAEKTSHQLTFFEVRLTEATVSLAAGFDVVCAFVNDELNAQVLDCLHESGVGMIALRCAGFNNIDLKHAEQLGVVVMRVPAYSPYAVAEHTVGLMLALNRNICRAYNRVRDGNFSLNGLIGFDFHGKTAGVIGTGKIGSVVCQILKGFGCRVLAHDIHHNPECIDMGVEYVALDQLYPQADMITLHCPLTHDSLYMINAESIAQMKEGVMLINTGRGGLVDTAAVIAGLKSRKIGYLGLDVYEQEGDLFFEDLSNHVIQDDLFERLLTFPNVLVTGHQGYFTAEAMHDIAETTLQNIDCFANNMACGFRLNPDYVVKAEK
jgi:D-lactate dehydrogenase